MSRPEPSALAEAERTRSELAALGVTHQRLIVNGVFTATEPTRSDGAALERRGRDALGGDAGRRSRALPRVDVPLLPWAPLGVSSSADCSRRELAVRQRPLLRSPMSLAGSARRPDRRRSSGSGRGVVLTMGKGGVGKTTVAAAIAIELAAAVTTCT